MQLHHIAFALNLFLASTGLAAPISYELSGVASGSLDDRAFSSERLTFTSFGDTDTVTHPFSVDYRNPAAVLAFSIDGLWSGLVFGNYEVFSTDTGVGLTDTVQGTDLWDVKQPTGLYYSLSTSIGPITAPSFVGNDTLSTTDGVLSFVVTGATTFTSVVVPEPSGLTLLMPIFIVCVALASRPSVLRRGRLSAAFRVEPDRAHERIHALWLCSE